MMFNSICPIDTVPKHFSETKILFSVSQEHITNLGKKVYLIVAEPYVKQGHFSSRGII